MSRIDVLVDRLLDNLAATDARAQALRGTTVIAYARLAYQHYKTIFPTLRWQVFAQHGARTQRLLWASTSIKDPVYSDVKYVEALIGPETVNTLLSETLNAYRDQDALHRAWRRTWSKHAPCRKPSATWASTLPQWHSSWRKKGCRSSWPPTTNCWRRWNAAGTSCRAACSAADGGDETPRAG